MNHSEVLAEQLKIACRLTGARWAAWVRRNPSGWEVLFQAGLSQARQAALLRFLQQPKSADWVSGSLTSGRARSRATDESAAGLDCDRVFVFANPAYLCAIVVGAGELERVSQGIFRILTLDSPFLLPEPSANGRPGTAFLELPSGDEPSPTP